VAPVTLDQHTLDRHGPVELTRSPTASRGAPPRAL